jgi:hypothetical protein
MITNNDLLECGFKKCDGDETTYFYADLRRFFELDMYAFLNMYGDFTKVVYNDLTEYPYKRKSIFVDDIKTIKNIISNFDLCIDKYMEVDKEYNRGISILDMVKQ